MYIIESLLIFSRGHATLHLAMLVGPSVGPSVRPSVRHISELRSVFALLLLPNRPRLDCRVSGLVSIYCTFCVSKCLSVSLLVYLCVCVSVSVSVSVLFCLCVPVCVRDLSKINLC